MRIAIVSACSAGIASTYMAAEALEIAARRRQHWVKAETQGTLGIENEISPQEAASVDVVIFAADIMIQKKERFTGKPVLEVGVAAAIRQAEAVIDRAEKLA
jgi:fructose-specific phosphotransferase system IIB component